MRYINKIKSYAAIGGLGVMAAFALAGCEGSNNAASALENSQKNGAFVVI